MPITLIQGNSPKISSEESSLRFAAAKSLGETLDVAEMFGKTVQGEGVYVGTPCTFLRLKGCTLDCVWCDTASVWREGDGYSFGELFEKMGEHGILKDLLNGHHLILTGGSPLKQQEHLTSFIKELTELLGLKPFIEVENEAVLMPTDEFAKLIDCWNNSPKLANSGMKERARYRPLVLSTMSSLPNSWFKFVVETEEDWQEIQMQFIDTELIKKEQIILMPCGENQEQLSITRPIAVEMAIKHGVRFSDRLHVTVWDKKTGV